jgi:PDGLE domain
MRANVKLFVVAGLLVGLALALLVSPFASSSPDGLEKVAAEEGFDGTSREHDTADSPLADYGVEGVENERVGTGLAGVVGVLLTFGIGLGLFAAVRALRPGDRSPASSASSASSA